MRQAEPTTRGRWIVVGDFCYPEGGASLSRVLNVGAAVLRQEREVVLVAMSGARMNAEFGAVPPPEPGYSGAFAWKVGNAHWLPAKVDWLLATYLGTREIIRALRVLVRPRATDVFFVYGRSYLRLIPVIRLAQSVGATVVLDSTEGIERFHGAGQRLNPVYWDWWLGGRILPRAADLVTAISSGLAERCESVGAKRTMLLPAIEEWSSSPPLVDERPAEDECFRLVVFGALNAKDAPEILCGVVAELKKRMLPVRIEIVGRYMADPVGRRSAARLAAIPDAFTRLRFRGSLGYAELQALLGRADGFLMLRTDSVAERLAFPTRLVELLRFAKPVLVSDVGDVTNYLRDNEHAFVLPKEPEGIVDRIAHLLALPDRGRAVGIAGWQRGAECFNRESQMRKVVAALGANLAAADTPVAGRRLVAILVNALGGGGAEKQVLFCAKLLVYSGYDCRLFVISSEDRHNRIEKLIVQARRAGVIVVRAANPSAVSGKVVFSLWLTLLRHREPVLWSWGYRADTVRQVLTWVVPRLTSVISLRSAHEKEIASRAMLWRWFDSSRPYYISNSYKNIAQLSRYIPGIFARSAVLHNAVESAALRAAAVLPHARPERLELVMLGNVRMAIKGYDFAVDLAARLKKRGVCFRLRIGGQLHEGQELRELIRSREVADVVQLQGTVSNPLEYLRSGHVFLLLSRVEGMPNALLEAMSVGLPCISSDVGDVRQFSCDGTALKVVEIGDVVAVEAQLLMWLGDWAAARRCGNLAAEVCERLFAADQVKAKQAAIFRAICHTPPRPAV